MALVYTVQADTRGEVDAALARLCADYGLQLRLPPIRVAGTDRWIARAAAAPDLKVGGRDVAVSGQSSMSRPSLPRGQTES